MALLAWLWLASPFALIGFVSHDRELLALIGAHPVGCRAIGWCGALSMLLGAAVVPGTAGWMMFLIGTPLAGLTVWGVGDDPDEDGGPPPDVPPVDWGDFERSFWAHVRRRGGRSRPRVPSAR